MKYRQGRVRFVLAVVSLAAITVAVAYTLQPRPSNATSDNAAITQRAAAEEVVLSDAQRSELSAGLSQSQQSLLSDGRLSFDEYRAAFLSFVACAESRGATAEGQMVRTKRGKLELPLAFSTGDIESVTAALQSCRTEYLSVIDGLWSMHVAPSKDELQQARESLAACLRASGFPGVPERPGPGDLVEFWPGHGSAVPPAVFTACQEQVDTQYDLPGFGG